MRGIDFKTLAMVCTGMMGWPPQVFWDSTMPEICVAIDGWLAATGRATRRADRPAADFLTQMLEKFPDRNADGRKL